MKIYAKLFIALMLSVFIATSSNATYTQEQVDEIVSIKAKETFDLINLNWSYLQNLNDLNAESAFWTPTLAKPSINSAIYPTLKLNDTQCDIIEAFRDLPTKPAHLECTIVVKLVKNLCLLELLGEDKFNEWLQILPKTTGRHPSDPLFFHVIPDRFFSVKNEGSGFYYVANHSGYTTMKPKGIGCGYNGFLFQDQQFISFDPVHFKETKSIEETQHILFEDIMSDENVEKINLHQALKTQYVGEDGFANFRLNCLETKQQSQPIWKFSADKINAFMDSGIIPKN
ncbi:MAG: hypothetical protein Q8S31_02650 [Alphaproteobacteria bacterium]|nr:hypothetical protein [Alphaproteobacteria bacterium]